MKSVYLLGPELSALRLVRLIGGSVGPAPAGPLWRLCLSLVELGLLDRDGESFLITGHGFDVLEQSTEQPVGARAFVRMGAVPVSPEL